MVVASTLTASECVCQLIISALEESGFGKEDVFAIHLALQEALINAMRHGNDMDPDKEVKIDYCVDAEKFEIWVSDEGKGFDPCAVPDPRRSENLYKPNGRGLLLMCSYMDVVEHNKRGNQVHMTRYKQSSVVSEKKG
ncbi:MAG: ATP-binding protein [Sedimentisphaerales bacterium]|nr:ATP-binding protein [Sedimentisphaerales bacterium]